MRFDRVGLGDELVPYQDGWARQRELHESVVAGGEDVVVELEHEHVYTAGRRTRRAERPDDGTPVVDVDRGGKITWHGPGQLVVYPIVRLAQPVDVVAYVRALESALIGTLGTLGVSGDRVEGRSGVWVLGDDGGPDRKIAAIGVRVAGGVTMHGLALNVAPDLTAFEAIVPCGITDAGVTSIAAETGRTLTLVEVADILRDDLVRALADVTAVRTVGA
ncbi:lipoate-protein ligase B [Beutenbergia cavernae DSM 12333]|uniref:Octanoyltransferase n=1 Tax=Beutenbergia cavernae (strain ATCC BAA-8 / DSM 12333 / CCUG 43141 / JCM 11478 / NBRC 16432 / NCIMB 13614 / HKI 0122) TaxID=471853 RepID=C5C4Y7_BEUC1|nr:lipoyl(octanoyl) transferase LipB [Beutenbergia cavernae]ACQ80115.1 lipoate-protein ligase B [Beutenbergia cavernae DSM 12333]